MTWQSRFFFSDTFSTLELRSVTISFSHQCMMPRMQQVFLFCLFFECLVKIEIMTVSITMVSMNVNELYISRRWLVSVIHSPWINQEMVHFSFLILCAYSQIGFYLSSFKMSNMARAALDLLIDVSRVGCWNRIESVTVLTFSIISRLLMRWSLKHPTRTRWQNQIEWFFKSIIHFSNGTWIWFGSIVSIECFIYEH